MSGQKLHRRIAFIMLVIFPLTANLPMRVQIVHADEGTTDVPTATWTFEPSGTLENTATSETGVIIDPPVQMNTETSIPSPTPIFSQTPTAMFTAAPQLAGSYISDEVLVRFKNSATDEMTAECLRRVNGRVDSAIEELSVLIVKLNSVSVSNAVATLSACEGVRFVEPNYLAFSADVIPSDANWGIQYGLVNIRAPQGWVYATGSTGVIIAILDTGVDLAHPDLAAKITAGWDFVNNDAFAQDDNGHGTHVAGIAAAVTNNGTGVAGVSWGARIMPVKVLNAAGGGTFANVSAGILWAVNNGADIINLSIGGPTSSIVLQNAIDQAVNQGVLVIAAVGNAGGNLIYYPAAYPNVIAVGATDSLNNHASLSNYGAEIDLVAPGISIYSTNTGSSYTYRNGTSMSTAFVSGLAAILMGIPGNGSSGQVRSIMENTALDLGSSGWDGFYGSGLIQMDAAILQAFSNSPIPIAATRTPLTFPQGGYLFTATSSATLPLTETLSLNGTQTSTLTLEPGSEVQESSTLTSEIFALETQTAPNGGDRSGWILPCGGILLILTGIFLFVLASKQKRRASLGPLR
jgi:thermitase